MSKKKVEIAQRRTGVNSVHQAINLHRSLQATNTIVMLSRFSTMRDRLDQGQYENQHGIIYDYYLIKFSFMNMMNNYFKRHVLEDQHVY